MKKLIFLIFSSLIFSVAEAQKQIPIDSAFKYIGQKVLICDSVYSIKVLPSLTFVNVGGNYPNQKLTLVFYKKDLYLLEIDPTKAYFGEKICVTGEVISYEHRPQIIIKAIKQITFN